MASFLLLFSCYLMATEANFSCPSVNISPVKTANGRFVYGYLVEYPITKLVIVQSIMDTLKWHSLRQK
jgi:hypothetical protein